jgi:hypothetical protein
MFGLFKRKISEEEFGQALVKHVGDWIYADADRSLLALISEEEIAEWSDELKRSNVSPDVRGLYRRFYLHHAIQCACTQFGEQTRQKITSGAMQLFKPAQGYDFNTAWSYLDHFFVNEAKVWVGFSKFDPPEALIEWLPEGYKDCAVKSSKILLNVFTFKNLNRNQITDEMFLRHVLTMRASVGTATRGIDFLFRKIKLK